MIQIHRDLAGNLSGFWDTELSQWVSPDADMLRAAELEGSEPLAADADDVNEPTPEPVDPNSLTKEQLTDFLIAWDVTIPNRASKLQLVELYETYSAEHTE
jgi:hypothetical protein